MPFKNKYEFGPWVGHLLAEALDDQGEDISLEMNNATGRCDVIVTLTNGKQYTLAITEGEAF